MYEIEYANRVFRVNYAPPPYGGFGVQIQEKSKPDVWVYVSRELKDDRWIIARTRERPSGTSYSFDEAVKRACGVLISQEKSREDIKNKIIGLLDQLNPLVMKRRKDYV